MHALTSLRLNAPSPPPTSSSASAPSATSPRLPDPNAVLAQLERAIAATEYSYASAQLASLSLNNSRHLSAGPFQRAAPQHRGSGDSAIPSKVNESGPGARVTEESRSAAGAGKVGPQQADCEVDYRLVVDEHGKELVSKDTAVAKLLQATKPKPLRKASSVDSGEVPRADVEVIHRRKNSSKLTLKIVASALPESDGPVGENGRFLDGETTSYDASVADQEYRAGSSALAESAPSRALLHFRLALSKCPRDKPSALAKIQRLISVAQGQLEMKGGADVAADSKKQASGHARQVMLQGGGFPDKLPMKVLQVGDVEAADNAYRAGVSALEKGEPARALEFLDKAARACPPDRPAAFAKIQLLMGQAHFELRLD